MFVDQRHPGSKLQCPTVVSSRPTISTCIPGMDWTSSGDVKLFDCKRGMAE
jgi:hypothetical protein